VTRKRIQVVAAVIERNNNIFIAKRPDHLHQGGLWEFPGGKVESNETPIDALKRELFEEIDITVISAQPLIKIHHDYHDKSVCLDVWRVTEFFGEAIGKENQEVRWISKHELNNFQFPAANKSIVTASILPAHYLITPEPAGMDELLFLHQLEQSFQRGIRLAQLRSKKLPFNELSRLYTKAKQLADRYDASLLLNASLDDAEKHNANQVHLSTANLMSLDTIPAHLFTAASCHNAYEIKKACELGVDFIVIAPVNKTQSHPDTKPMGWDEFEKLCNLASIPVYALGGMSKNDTKIATNKGAQGIAAISALWWRIDF